MCRRLTDEKKNSFIRTKGIYIHSYSDSILQFSKEI